MLWGAPREGWWDWGKKYFFPNMLVLTPFLRAITECTNGAMCDVRISF